MECFARVLLTNDLAMGRVAAKLSSMERMKGGAANAMRTRAALRKVGASTL